MRGNMDKIFARKIIRNEHWKSDIAFLVISSGLGCLAGLLMAVKIAPAIGAPFAAFSTCILYFTWRNPGKPKG
jgi:hypothetical protein